ncbi:TauD/TfdA family dioxygenase [Actinomadura monticuli]|uniref:TauD/TfdA family dioxygenase n=1 Tax=Actinomadura monticuli TaxID=3097367 RepID=A0ABV4Q7Y6_9ACTN
MVHGAFHGNADIDAARSAILDRLGGFPEPRGLTRRTAMVTELLARPHDVAALARRRGALWYQLDRVPECGELRRFAEAIGTPIPEHDPAVRSRVREEVVLEMRNSRESPADVSSEPFSLRSLRLHTEASRRPAADRPDLIVLACVRAPAPGHGLQTLLVSSASVLAGLTDAQLDVLRALTLDDAADTPILRREAGRDVLSFRDFTGDVGWRCADPSVSAEDVTSALIALLLGCYREGHVRGVRWTRAGLLLFDNAQFLHGRTRGSGAEEGDRWLRRIRVICGR